MTISTDARAPRHASDGLTLGVALPISRKWNDRINVQE